jgi:thermolysin metallopeptidase-like protein
MPSGGTAAPLTLPDAPGPGGTWQAPQQVSGSETTGGSDGGDIKTNTYGDVFAFWPSEGNQKLFVAKSTDGGATFGTPVLIATTSGSFLMKIPAEGGRGALIYISGGAYRTPTKDMVYAIWMDLVGGSGCNTPGNAPGSNTASTCKTRIFFSRSHDGGAHWGTPIKINDQSSLNDQFFPRLAVDARNGDLVVIYYDTVADPNRVKTDVWLQSSTDDDGTWSAAVKVTTAQTDETSSTASGAHYGDYIGLTGYAGQYFACWTDRRSGGVEEIWGAPLRIVAKQCTFIVERSTFGQDEIDARRGAGSAVIPDAFRVVVDGFTAAGFGQEQAERLIEMKLLKSFQNILTIDQYAKLKEQFKSAALTELRRAIYDAENHQSLPGKLVRSEGESASEDPIVTQVYDNIDSIYKFFNSVFDRNISRDIGGPIVATVHFGNEYNNAFWNDQQLVIGDGDGTIFKTGSFGSLSIVAEELSHSVITRSVRLPYMGEPGALHSHLTDVFATLTEQWKKKQTVDEASWLVGADVLAPGIKGVALRSMQAPGTAFDDLTLGKDPQPNHMSKYVKGDEDNGGVHINSGIPNRAFYEVAKGIGGYAWVKAGKIWYEAMLKLKENSTFNDYAQTTYEVAGRLYGEGSLEQEAVGKGWETVGIAVGKGQKPEQQSEQEEQRKKALARVFTRLGLTTPST